MNVVILSFRKDFRLSDNLLRPYGIWRVDHSSGERRLNPMSTRDLVGFRRNHFDIPILLFVEAADFLRDRDSGRLGFDQELVDTEATAAIGVTRDSVRHPIACLLVGDDDQAIVRDPIDLGHRGAERCPAVSLGPHNGIDAGHAAPRRHLDDLI